MRYRSEIDGLRALAILPVIFFHAGFKIFSGGFIGVDIFFVISGYLITSIIISENNSASFSIIHFYERRARRILPALFFVMLVCLPFAWLWLLPEDMKSFCHSLITVPTFLSNFLFWKTSGYFDIAAELKPLLHTWSLAVEEQYYLLFPLLMIIIWQFGRKIIVTLLLTLLVASLGLAQWASVTKPDAAYYLLLTRGWEILLGSIVAFYLSSSQFIYPSERLQQVGSAIGLAFIGYAIFAFDSQTPFPGLYALIPTLGAALIIIYAHPSTIVGRLLSTKWSVGLGLGSYSAYLWHQPVLAFARHRSSEDLSLSLTILLLALIAVLTFFTWKYIEAPFRKRGHFNRGQIFTWSILAASAFITIGIAGHITQGFEKRFTFISAYEGDIGHTDFYNYLDNKFFLCAPRSIANDPQNKVTFRCLQSKQNSDIDIALIGDSHAEHLFLGIAQTLSNKNVLLHARGSYPSIDSHDFQNIYQYILDTSSIHTVIITAHWISRIDMIPKNTSLEKELSKTIGLLIQKGKKVYLFDDVPKFSFPPERCKYMVESLGKTICTIPKDSVLRSELSYSGDLKSIVRNNPKLIYFEPKDIFCNNINCSMIKNDILMYRDNNHLNIMGSNLLGEIIVDKFPDLKLDLNYF
jgi:peptidoglycan/LPS O-acetylase OafA/YrhL